MKIRILYLATTSQLFGAEKMVYELARGLDKKKYEIMVCTIKDDLNQQLLSKLREEGIKTDCLNINKKIKFWRVFKLFKIINNFKPDIIQSFLFFDNILARIVGRITKVPVIISGQRNTETNRSYLRNLIDKHTIFLTDLIISNAESGKKLLVQREKVNPQKIKVIYNSIEVKKHNFLNKNDVLKELNISEYAKIIGFIGRLTKQKGIKYLIDAMELIDKKSNIYCIIIGDGKEKRKLKEYARNKNILFLGWKDNALQYMKIFDVFVLSSLWEGTPNVILEAMVSHIPVVSTKVGGVPEIIEDRKTGFLVEPKNSQELAKIIKYVLNLPEREKKEIEERAKKTVEKKFPIGKMVSEYEKLYQELLQ